MRTEETNGVTGRRARLRLVHTEPDPLPSTEALANTGEPSVHELTLTRRRKEADEEAK
jgi:hypothetical protein